MNDDPIKYLIKLKQQYVLAKTKVMDDIAQVNAYNTVIDRIETLIARLEMTPLSKTDTISCQELSQKMTGLQNKKPRPLKKWYGPNPTFEQQREHKQAMSAWQNEYNRLSRLHKKQLDIENAEFRAKQSISSGE